VILIVRAFPQLDILTAAAREKTNTIGNKPWQPGQPVSSENICGVLIKEPLD